MKLRNSIIFCWVFVVACSESSDKLKVFEQSSDLWEAADVVYMAERPNIRLIDFRRKADYGREHLPNAVNIWRSDIENADFPYGGMMASESQIETLLGNLGISSKDTLVIYDNAGLCNAARLWWLLQNYDFDQVKLMHGGIAAWKASGGVLTQEVPNHNATTFSLSKDPSMKFYLSKEQMEKALSVSAAILDTRSYDEYTGKRQKKGASKAGRIPGSQHLDWAAAIEFEGDQRMKSLKQLELIYGSLVQSKDDSIVVYCHSGVRSAHTTFVLTELLGYSNVKNYDGSWTEWSYFDELPFQVDSATTIQ